MSLGSYGVAFRPTLLYTDTSVELRLDPNFLVSVGGDAITGNALAFATSFDAAVMGGYDPQPFFNLYTQGTNLNVALGQFSGELHSAERRVALQDTRAVRESALDSLNADLVTATGTSSVTNEADGKAMTAWMRAAGSWSKAQADGIGSAFKTELKGVLLGADFTGNGFKIGGLFHQTSTDLDLGNLGKSTVESVGATLYAGYRQDGSGFAVGVGAGLANNTTAGFRVIDVPGLSQGLAANTSGMTYQIFGEASFDLVKADNGRIEPFVRIARVMLDAKAFAETGGIAALRAGKQSNALTTTTFGLRGVKVVGETTLSSSSGWQRTIGDRSAPTFAAVSGVDIPYEVRSVALDRDSVAFETQANFSLSQHLSVGFGYSAVLGRNNSDHSGRATIRYAF
jgi:outer membrane autotransporter protein